MKKYAFREFRRIGIDSFLIFHRYDIVVSSDNFSGLEASFATHQPLTHFALGHP